MNHILEYTENTKKDENINEIWINFGKKVKNYIIEHFNELIIDESNIKELNKDNYEKFTKEEKTLASIKDSIVFLLIPLP